MLKVEAAETEWAKQMWAAKTEMKRQADEMRTQVLKHINMGAEAARIQAYAIQRAKELRDEAYQRALKEALNVEAAV